MKKISFIILSLGLITVSCTNTSTDDLTEPVPMNIDVTYEANIKTILTNNCTVCHSNPPVNGAPISLVTYNDAINAVLNGNLIDRISRQPGEAGFMPFSGVRLPQNLIDVVIKWQDEGFIEN